MKKFLALLLTLCLLGTLCACKGVQAASGEQEQHTVTAPTDDASFVYQPEDPTLVPVGGGKIVLAAGPEGPEGGADAMLWQGVQTFADAYGYTAESQTAAGNTADDAEAALRAAAESGAKLVVCRGDAMGAALYRIQGSYPDVHYLLFDSEPHTEDYSAYTTAELVHCVLFQEEQAGYLAGYASVMDGYTAAKAIRASGHADVGRVPIIAMSANAYAEDVRQCLACGMNAHISKPLYKDVMLETIERFV